MSKWTLNECVVILLEVKSTDKDVGSLLICHRSGRLARAPRSYRIFSVSMIPPEPDHNTLLLKIAYSQFVEHWEIKMEWAGVSSQLAIYYSVRQYNENFLGKEFTESPILMWTSRVTEICLARYFIGVLVTELLCGFKLVLLWGLLHRKELIPSSKPCQDHISRKSIDTNGESATVVLLNGHCVKTPLVHNLD